MSGPKVVRVVTREERIASCTTWLARLDAALEALRTDAARLGDEEGMGMASSRARREELAALVRQGSFDQADRQLPQELALVEASRRDMIERAAQAATSARERAMRQRQAAALLIRELEREAPGQHADLLKQLRAVLSRSNADGAGEALSKAMRVLSPAPQETQLSDAQRALAASLMPAAEDADESVRRLVDTAGRDRRLADLQARLSQIEVLQGLAATEAFSARLALLEAEPDSAARSMRIDALTLDVAAAVDALKREVALLDRSRSVLSELATVPTSEELVAARQELQRAISRRAVQDLPQIVEATLAAVGRARLRVAAAARREAILSGLASLGYQVDERMSTAWVDNGRVVLRKQDGDLHGLEIASTPDAERLQLRAVAFSTARSPTSDLAAETAWCGDLSKLQAHLKRHSSDLSIEKAMPVGSVALKAVAPLGPAQAQEAAARSRRTR
ncbi:hypothetical protein [Ideonella sp. YS5]|uniref:hypothetical protein n=1 Tax=Ideonella sp. YS5 TaxID=3453714 RepID=UPI003EEA6360